MRLFDGQGDLSVDRTPDESEIRSVILPVVLAGTRAS
jgi:hypothetical protein